MTPATTARPLDGRVAIVTGASRGIGLATARALAGAGARVAMLARSATPLDAAAREIGALAVPCDIADERAVHAALKRVTTEAGDPEILVNNAGVFHLAPFE